MSETATFINRAAFSSKGTSRTRTMLWWVMLLACAGVSIYATTYFLLPVRNRHFSQYIVPLRLHIAGGIGALLVGPWQFSTRLRTRALALHRWLGRFYLVEVMLGSIAGFSMALVSLGGLPTHLGFGLLAILWFLTGLQAYRVIRRRDTAAHRRWMIRNFALTLAAVTLRIYLPLFLMLHWPFERSYVVVSWLCWVPNLLVAEWMIRRRMA